MSTNGIGSSGEEPNLTDLAREVERLGFLTRETQRHVDDRESLGEFRIAEKIAELRVQVETDQRRAAEGLIAQLNTLDSRVCELARRNDAEKIVDEELAAESESTMRLIEQLQTGVEQLESAHRTVLASLLATSNRVEDEKNELHGAIQSINERIDDVVRTLQNQHESMAELRHQMTDVEQSPSSLRLVEQDLAPPAPTPSPHAAVRVSDVIGSVPRDLPGRRRIPPRR